MEIDNGRTICVEVLVTIPKNPESAEGSASNEITKRKRNNSLDNVRLREEAATRCTAKIKRRAHMKQTMKARAEHVVIAIWNQ